MSSVLYKSGVGNNFLGQKECHKVGEIEPDSSEPTYANFYAPNQFSTLYLSKIADKN